MAAGSPRRALKLGIAAALFAATGAVLAWTYVHSSEPRVDPSLAQKQEQIREGIQSATPKAGPEPAIVPRSRAGQAVNPVK